MQPSSVSPSVARLGANRKLAAQVNGFQQPPTVGGAAGLSPASSLSPQESELLRNFLASLARK